LRIVRERKGRRTLASRGVFAKQWGWPEVGRQRGKKGKNTKSHQQSVSRGDNLDHTKKSVNEEEKVLATSKSWKKKKVEASRRRNLRHLEKHAGVIVPGEEEIVTGGGSLIEARKRSGLGKKKRKRKESLVQNHNRVPTQG